MGIVYHGDVTMYKYQLAITLNLPFKIPLGCVPLQKVATRTESINIAGVTQVFYNSWKS